jgi:hypothetical protein
VIEVVTQKKRQAAFKAGRAAAAEKGWKPNTKMTKTQKAAFNKAYDAKIAAKPKKKAAKKSKKKR